MFSLHMLSLLLFFLLPFQILSQPLPILQIHQLDLNVTQITFAQTSPSISPQILLPPLGGENVNNSNVQLPQPVPSTTPSPRPLTPVSTPTPSSSQVAGSVFSDTDPNVTSSEEDPDESPQVTTDEPIGVGTVSNTGSGRVGGLVAASITLALIALIATATAFFITPRTASEEDSTPLHQNTTGDTEATGITSQRQPV